ncbi:MAG: WG repeat-containing protein [Chitinophagaceae bacterium]|nr:WG repeat-containing protein [Chitinophagaceae bacterium]
MKKILLLVFVLPGFIVFGQKWEKNYDYVDNCVCGLSKVKKAGKVGYVNKEGVEVVKPIFDDGNTFNEGYAAVRLGEKWHFIDSTGKAITEPLFDDAINFSNGMAVVAKNNQYGFINTKGELVIPFQYSNARNFSEGLAPAANTKGYWGYVDVKGNWVIKPAYDFSDCFQNGEARVMKGQKIVYIDKNNTVVHE